MHKYILMLPLKKYPFCPESIENERSYFGFRQKSAVFSNWRIYARFGPKDIGLAKISVPSMLHFDEKIKFHEFCLK